MMYARAMLRGVLRPGACSTALRLLARGLNLQRLGMVILL